MHWQRLAFAASVRSKKEKRKNSKKRVRRRTEKGAWSIRPFAQLLPGLETGHPVTVGQSPTCSFSVSDGREVLFLSPFRAVLGAIHVQVTDRPPTWKVPKSQ